MVFYILNNSSVEFFNRLRYLYRTLYPTVKNTLKGHMSVIPEVALNALFQYLDARGIRDTIEADDYLFTALPSYHGKGRFNPKRPLSEGTVGEIVQGYAQKAGIPHPVVVNWVASEQVFR